MAALILPVSGPYTATWNANALGMMNDDGYELSVNFKAEEINATDAGGMTLLDAVYRGQDWRVRLTGKEWKAALLNILQPFGATTAGVLNPLLGSIGSKYSAVAQSLVLTSVLGGQTPATLTALQSVIAPNSRSAFNLTSKVRDLPLELVLLPYTSSTIAAASPFTCT